MELRGVAVSLALVAGVAQAQVPPITVSSQPYVPLSGATPITFTGRGSSNTDEGWAQVNLPFQFPYFGQSYSSFFIDTNGFVSLGSACSVGTFSSTCYSNQSFPSPGAPNGVIAGVWDDMEISPTTIVRVLVGPSEATVEYVDLTRYPTNSRVTFQITLSASGAFSIHHGPMSGVGADFNFSAGFENQDGTLGANLFANCTTLCAGTGASPAHYVPDRLFLIGQPNEADLVTSAVSIANFARQPDGNLSFDVNATIQNQGKTAANGFSWRAYLSTDRTLDATDQQVAQGGPLSIVASSGGLPVQVVVSGAALTTTPPSTGEYFVLVEADSGNAVTEASEVNNVGATATALVQGTDLVAGSISGPAGSAAGQSGQYSISFFNRGVIAAGSTTFRLFLSADAVLDASDFPIFTDTRTVGGGQSISESLSVVLPATAPLGTFRLLLVVDPGNAIAEASEQNNVVASAATMTVTRADLVASALALLDPVTGAPVSRVRFGGPVRARFTLHNPTAVDAANFYVALVLSTDANFSLLQDTWVCSQLVPLATGGAPATTVTLDCQLPVADAAGGAFVSGDYHLLALADATGVVAELVESNNGAALGPLRIVTPGPDLTVGSLEAPAVAGAGEVMLVERTLRNEGTAAVTGVAYRYLASRDAQRSTDDEPLDLLPGGTSPTPGVVTLGAGAEDVAMDRLLLPATLAPGPWFVVCEVDGADAVVEMDEANNTRVSRPVTVVVAGLFVAADQAPDAVVNRPYAFQLGAQGGQGALTWSVVPGAGELPAGLSLSGAGLLSGTPTAASVSSFTVRVTDGVSASLARLVLRVTSALAPLEIVTTSLPPVLAGGNATYGAELAATGGRPPYTWRVAEGTLPSWLSLSAGGALAGPVPGALAADTLRFTVEVADASGARAQRAFAVLLRPAPGFALRTAWLTEAVVGQPWSQAVIVGNADGSPPATPLRFVLSGALPAGVELDAAPDGATFGGTPAAAGEFPLELTVEDALGREARASYLLRVHPARTAVFAAALPEVVRPGDEVSFRFTLGTQRAATWALLGGALPPGLNLAADGTVSGQLAAAEPPGRWDFVVVGTDVSGVEGLGAFTLVVDSRAAGCSAAGGLAAPGALLVLLGLAARRRRLVAAVAAAVCVVAPVAWAQAGYQVTGPTPTTYAPLDAGVPVTSNASVTLPFALRLGASTYTTAVMSQHGYLAFGGASPLYSNNQPIPYMGTSTLVPRALIVPWWDVLTAASQRMLVTGQAPNRVVAFEWNAGASGARVSFQAELHEGTGRIRFSYAPVVPGAGSASVGVQADYRSGTPGLFCATTGSCGVTQYPAGQVLEFSRPPELAVDGLGVTDRLHVGAPVALSARVTNTGGRDVSNVVVRFYASTDAALDASDLVLGSTLGATVTTSGEAVVSTVGSVPGSAPTGAAWLFARVDPDNLHAEVVESNNVSPPVAVTVVGPAPDLVASGVQAPSSAAPGASVQVSRVIENVGSAAIASTRYTWFLSANAVVSVGDRPLGVAGTLASLAAAARDTATESVLLPADVAPGSYWLGLCANYDPASPLAFGVGEITLTNNCAAATTATVVSSGALTISTTSLPAATAWVPYGAWLSASGASGGYAWSVGAAGRLPTGLELTPAGELRGTPVEVGTFSVELQVSSGSATQATTLQLEVRSEQPLAVLEQQLPTAQAGQDYEARLVASGGKGPYQWALGAGAQLPPGLALAADGTLSGRVATPGTFPFEAAVTDALGASARGSLLLEVAVEASPRFLTVSLPPAVLGQPWSAPLVVTGGELPYAVHVVRFQELPLDATDVPGQPVGDGSTAILLPAELGLAREVSPQGVTTLAGTPRRAGRFSLHVEAVNAAQRRAFVELVLVVTATPPLELTTTTLPEAEVGTSYEAQLEASLPAAAFSAPCARHAESVSAYVCVASAPAAQLPLGLSLSADGRLTGVPLATGSREPMTFSFLVKATRPDGQRAVRALSITVRPGRSAGCSASGALAAPWLVVLVAGLARGRRRR